MSVDLILRISGAGEEYAVETTARFDGGTLSTAQAGRIKLDLPRLRALRLQPDEYGRALSAQVFNSRLREQFLTVSSRGRVRVLLQFGDPAQRPTDAALHDVCWELLRFPLGYQADLVALDSVSVSRLATSTQLGVPGAPLAMDQTRVVVAVAAPTDLVAGRGPAPIERDVEVEAALSAFASLDPGQVRILRRQRHDVLDAPDDICTAEALRQELVAGCDVLYLLCHGMVPIGAAGLPPADARWVCSCSPELGGAASHEAQPQGHTLPTLVLQEPNGTAAYVPGKRLVDDIQRLERPPALVVLASCGSAGGPFASLGHELVTTGRVGAVLAMRGQITVAGAHVFLRQFFRDLFEHGDPALAATRARDLLGRQRAEADAPARPDERDRPVLYQRFVGPSFLPSSLWSRARTAAEENLATLKYRADRALYVERDVERRFEAFVNSDKATMVLVGQSGMGKTTLVAELAERYAAQGHVCRHIPSSSLPGAMASIEGALLNKLGRQPGVSEEDFWADLQKAAEQKNNKVLLFIDAVNEYNRPAASPGPNDFLGVIDELTRKTFEKKRHRIKFFVTSRPETWRQGVNALRIQLSDRLGFYVSKSGLAFQLPRFTATEAEKAYRKYRTAHAIKTDYQGLTELARYYLRDPLLLSLACLAHAGGEMPAELDTDAIFRKYREHLAKDAEENGHPEIGALLDRIALAFLRDPGSCIVARDSLVLDGDFQRREPDLFDRLTKHDSPGAYLSGSKNVLLVSREDAGPGVLRFTYDRFAEHLVTGVLTARVRLDEDRTRATIDVIRDNLPTAQKLNTVFGILQRLLLAAREDEAFDALLDGVAELGEHGLALVVSVLARIAMSRDGIEIVAKLLSRVMTDSARRSFPIIEAVYRTLEDEEYQLWLIAQPEPVRQRHRVVLHECFVWGLQRHDELVSGAAVQYLFFLWTNGRLQAEAIAITERAVQRVSLFNAAVTRLLGWHSSTQFSLFRNLACVFLLVLAEGDERTVREAIKPALKLMRRLPAGLINLFGGQIGRYGADVIAQNVQPIDRKAADEVFRDSRLRDAVIETSRLCGPGGRIDAMSVEALVALAANPNAYVFQMLSFALSCAYERAEAGPARSAALKRIEDIFGHADATPQVQYCASIAMYHINYFGEGATAGPAGSLRAMERMANTILQRHRGVFTAADGQPRNFNIIGTYGRVLKKHEQRLQPDSPRRTPWLQFAIDALDEAKRRGPAGAGFYLYVCRNLGLLGVLVEPTQVFEAITCILTDLGLVPEPGGVGRVPFPEEELRTTILQSLANVRVIHRQAVDRYLLDVVDAPGLRTTVAGTRPEFSLSLFVSWTFEQLMFRMLTRYWDRIGSELLRCIEAGLSPEVTTADDCFARAGAQMLRHLVSSAVEDS